MTPQAYRETVERFRSSPAGSGEIAATLTATLDDVLAELWQLGERAVALAVGGYGRAEMCLGSDVDVMVLHDGSVTAPDLQPFWYPLWDAKLKVGHASRTLSESVTAARSDLATLTALLTARPVAGSFDLWEQLSDRLAKLVSRRRPALDVSLAEAEHAKRRDEPWFLLAADVKQGRGCLRTVHALEWSTLARSDREPSEDLRTHRQLLLDVRNALHAVTGRTHDVFDHDLRDPAARWLGVDALDLANRLHASRRAIDDAAHRRWPSGADAVGPGMRRWQLRAARQADTDSGPRRPLALAERVASTGGALDDSQRLWVERAGASAWTETDQTAFVRLLAAGRGGQTAFEELTRLGWTELAFPEWAAASDRAQVAPFHAYTVGGHLWRTVDEVRTLSEDAGLCGEVADDLGSLDDLLLAAFFHDVGKGHPGDHSVVGAQLTTKFLDRAGYRPAGRRRVALAVRHHLLLPAAATRRDIDDPGVIADVARQVDDAQQLRLLYLLAIADWRATGDRVFTAWKASLLERLFLRTLRHLGGALPDRRATIGDILEAAGGAVGRERIAAHLDALPPEYADRHTPDEIVRHLRLTRPSPHPGEVRIDTRDDGEVTSLVVVSRDRRGLAADVAGVLALHDVAIVDARLTTGRDGVAIDVFTTHDGRTGRRVDSSRWSLVRASFGRLGDLDRHLAEKRHAHRGLAPTGGSMSATVAPASDGARLEVRGGDRIGVLHDLARVISDSGADIETAKIDTRAGRFTNVFQVRRSDGAPLPEADLEELRRRIEAL